MKKTYDDSKPYDALALLSGGLDSILAYKAVENLGLRILGVHFISSFFGDLQKLAYWNKIYNIDIFPYDISHDYLSMMEKSPVHGFGKNLNPCIDCKILMLRKAKELLPQFGAKFLITGEVIGQRPMSQRRDALDIIERSADVNSILLRPLCAKNMSPTEMELSGLVEREKLFAFQGRGRKDQLALAKEYKIEIIPTPAGGCLLTEEKTIGSYYQLFKHASTLEPENFTLTQIGRNLWKDDTWLIIGRNQQDNEHLLSLGKKTDYLFHIKDFAGPVAFGRPLKNVSWTEEEITAAASLMAAYSSKAVQEKTVVDVIVTHDEKEDIISVFPDRTSAFGFTQSPIDGLKEWKMEKRNKKHTK